MQQNKNKTDKINVAHIANNFGGVGGISEVVTNICCNLDKEKFKITVFYGYDKTDRYTKICQKNTVDCIKLPNKQKHIFKYYRDLKRELKKGDFQIAHVHGNSALLMVEMLACISAGIKVRVAHCHNSHTPNENIHNLLKPLFNKLCTKRIACSIKAGKFLYGNKNFKVIDNAINIDKYTFNENHRKNVRKLYGFSNEDVVLCSVGRLAKEKNQEYILRVAKELQDRHHDVKCLFVGSGDMESVLHQKASELKIDLVVVDENDMPEQFYSASDIFLMPSIYEGFGNTMIEAQINGLPCVASRNVPSETRINENVVYLPISADDIGHWGDTVVKLSGHKKSHKGLFEKYDSHVIATEIEKIYTR